MEFLDEDRSDFAYHLSFQADRTRALSSLLSVALTLLPSVCDSLLRGHGVEGIECKMSIEPVCAIGTNRMSIVVWAVTNGPEKSITARKIDG